MKITIDDSDYIDLLRILKEKKVKHEKLHELARDRARIPAFKKNAERLMNKHTAKKEVAERLIKKIQEQI